MPLLTHSEEIARRSVLASSRMARICRPFSVNAGIGV